MTNWDQPVLLIAKADEWLHNIELLSGCSKDSHVNLGVIEWTAKMRRLVQMGSCQPSRKKSKNERKDQESIESSTKPDTGHHMGK